MHAEIVERDDLSVYVIAGVPRSFKTKLRDFVRKEAKDSGDVIQLDGEMTEWVVAQLRDEKRPSKTRTPASRALWRAFSALSAARSSAEDPLESRKARKSHWRAWTLPSRARSNR